MRAASIGVSVRATKSEITTALATVSPNSFRKFPMIPLTAATGRNTAAIDESAAMAAKVTCRVPFEAASKGASPPSRLRSMFSITTMASSMTTPTTNAMASSVITLSVKPITQMTPNVATSESGIERPTIRVGRVRRRNTNTVTVASRAPKNRANSVSATASRMANEKSIKPSPIGKDIPAGMVSWIRVRRRRASSAIATVLAPGCFSSPMHTVGSPL